MPRSPYAEGIWVGDEILPEGPKVGAWVDRKRAEIKARHVVLHYGGQFEELSYEDIGVDLDIGPTLAAAAAVAHRGSISDNIEEAQAAKRGEIRLPIRYRVNETKIREIVERIAAAVKVEPVDARMDLKNRKKFVDVPGQALDVESAIAAIVKSSWDDVNGVSVSLPIKKVRANVTVEELVDVDVTKVLSAQETTFVTFGVGVGRSVNITRAAAGIDGVVIPPGEVFSFNENVGPRTLERGFTWAPEIQGDELTTGVGGGTCQVSSTLFNAAIFGALEVVERQSHSRPSSYAKIGLDATVVYNSVDLRIRNPFKFPIMLHAFLPKPGVVRVEILGGDAAAKVTYSYGIGGVADFVRRITVKNHLQPGTRVRRQKGSRGMDVSSVIKIEWLAEGRTEERRYFSFYRPAPEVYWVAPGYDESELPPLPEHARGVEGRLYDGADTGYGSPL